MTTTTTTPLRKRRRDRVRAVCGSSARGGHERARTFIKNATENESRHRRQNEDEKKDDDERRWCWRKKRGNDVRCADEIAETREKRRGVTLDESS